MRFLKKHYEKFILCVVLLGLAVAAVLMGKAIRESKQGMDDSGNSPAAPHSKSTAGLDLGVYMRLLAQVTNPPPVVLSGAHNLFNPVTWKRTTNGNLMEVLRSGPDALVIQNINPLYTTIWYNYASLGGIFVFKYQTNSGRIVTEYPKLNEKTRSGLYTVRGIEGAVDNPTRVKIEIMETQEMVWVSTNSPYKKVDGYTVEMYYPPDSKTFKNLRLNGTFTLDSEPYKIVDITSNAVRVESIKNTKSTTVPWSGAAEPNASVSANSK